MSELPAMPCIPSPDEILVLRLIAVGEAVQGGAVNSATVERLLRYGFVTLEMGEPCASDAGLRELGILQ